MIYYIISDTHFGHANMVEYCGRPKDFEEKILHSLEEIPWRHPSVLIHLGDFCFLYDKQWHEIFLASIPNACRAIFVRGNHDKKSNSWYMNIGWHFVCEEFSDTVFGKKILFSHIPRPISDYDFNIHGHFHNNIHRSAEDKGILTDKHLLYAPELNEYKPINLERFIVRERKQ